MDIALLKQVVNIPWYFGWLIPLVVLAVIIQSSWFKGKAGEFIVNFSAKLLLDKKHYHLIKNVTLPTADGTTQIDHIIVSIFGIFVIETKNMNGWIFGKQGDPVWIQKMHHNYSSQFQNPLRQNYKHIKTLQSLLGLSDQQIHSVIVFIGNSTFKTELPDNVTHGKGYIKYIKSKTEAVLTEVETKEITKKIEEKRLKPSFKTDRGHVRHVRRIAAEKKNNNIPHSPQRGAAIIFSGLWWRIALSLVAIGVFVPLTWLGIQKMSSTLGENFARHLKQGVKSPNASTTSFTSPALPLLSKKPEQTQTSPGSMNSFSYKIALKSGREIAAQEASRDGDLLKIVTGTGLYMEIPWQDVNYMLETDKR